ncbi:unnamed protein product [Ectocarpus sp. CCAP 1310/34]|nr:unnamed protein product [Ectocarpus sp. CCAP 1310/34]
MSRSGFSCGKTLWSGARSAPWKKPLREPTLFFFNSTQIVFDIGVGFASLGNYVVKQANPPRSPQF